jgi:hypothetical protein
MLVFEKMLSLFYSLQKFLATLLLVGENFGQFSKECCLTINNC